MGGIQQHDICQHNWKKKNLTLPNQDYYAHALHFNGEKHRSMWDLEENHYQCDNHIAFFRMRVPCSPLFFL